MSFIFVLVITIGIGPFLTRLGFVGDASMVNVQQLPSRILCFPCTCSANNTVANCSHVGLLQLPSNLPETLNKLLLDHNNLSQLIPNGFSKFKKLIHLDISKNNIHQVPSESFNGLTDLRCLRMEDNHIQFLDQALSVLHSLEELSLDGSPNMTFGEHFQNLTKLTSLSLSGHGGRCNIGNIFNNTFEYVPHLKTLNLSFCGLNNIEPGTFVSLIGLEELDISDNYDLKFENFRKATYGLVNSPIKVLKANAIVASMSICNILKGEHTRYLKITKLKKLYFDHNRLEIVQPEALSNLPSTLWFISARFNSITNTPYVTNLSLMKGVTHLYLGNEDSRPIPARPFPQEYVDDTGQCLLDSFTDCQHSLKSSYEYNLNPSTSSPYSIQVPPHLQVLHVTCAQLYFDIKRIHFTANNMTYLKLNCNLLGNWIGPVTGLNQLTFLDLSNNVARSISTTFFRSFPNLKVLNISFNIIGSVMNTVNMSHIFDGLSALVELDMSLNDIHGIPDDIFQDLISLQTLNLSNNAIYLNVPLRVSHMKKTAGTGSFE